MGLACWEDRRRRTGGTRDSHENEIKHLRNTTHPTNVFSGARKGNFT